MGDKAAKWLLENRNVLGYGIDCIGLDAGDSGTDFKTHRVVLSANQFILENVGSRVRELPPRDFFLMAMPYKLGEVIECDSYFLIIFLYYKLA